MPENNHSTLPIALEESRIALWCGWEGSLTFQSASWGTVTATGPGFTQLHADILDFSRSFYRKIDFDLVERPTLSIFFADFAAMRGKKPDSTRHRKLLEDFLQTTIQLTLKDGRHIKFVVADRTEYKSSIENDLKPIPPKKGKSRQDDLVRVHNRECISNVLDGEFHFRLSSEFVDFLETSMYVDYSALLPDILRMTDTQKRIARFFLSHQAWRFSTEQLYRAIYQEDTINSEKEIKSEKRRLSSLRSSRQATMRNSAALLKEVIGIEFNEKTDYWHYKQHPSVFISNPLRTMSDTSFHDQEETHDVNNNPVES